MRLDFIGSPSRGLRRLTGRVIWAAAIVPMVGAAPTWAQALDLQLAPAIFCGRAGDVLPSGSVVSAYIRAHGDARGRLTLTANAGGAGETYVDDRCAWGCGFVPLAFPGAIGYEGSALYPNDGVVWCRPAAIVPTVDGQIYYVPFLAQGHRLVLNSLGQPCGWPGAPANWEYLSLSRVSGSDPNSVLVHSGWVDSTTGSSGHVLARFRTDGQGRVLGEDLVLLGGQLLPGATAPIQNFVDIDSSSDGRSAVVVTAGNVLLWVDGQIVLRGLDPGPDAGTTISDIWACSVNASGQWAAHTDLNPSQEHVLYVDGVPIMRGNTDFAPRRVTSVTGFELTDRGDVFYRATFDDLTAAICANNQILVDDHGSFEVNGEPLYGPNLDSTDVAVDPSGTHISFRAWTSLAGGWANSRTVILPVDLSSTYCSGLANSTGHAPALGVFGALYPHADRTVVHAARLPPGSTALALASTTQGHLPGAGGALGDLCIAGSIRRSMPRTVALDGKVTMSLGELAPGGALPASGETWHFQLWYRDSLGTTGGAVTRFSEAVRVTFK
jgi:hypothetical protein